MWQPHSLPPKPSLSYFLLALLILANQTTKRDETEQLQWWGWRFFMGGCERGNAFCWSSCCAIILTQFGTMWVWDTHMGRKVQYCENWTWNAVNCLGETSGKWRKHLMRYTQRILTVPKDELPSFSFLSPPLPFQPHVVPKCPRK